MLKIEDIKVGDFVWFHYSQDYPVAKYYNTPAKVTAVGDKRFTALYFDDMQVVELTLDDRFKSSTKQAAMDYLHKRILNLKKEVLEIEEKLRTKAGTIDDLRSVLSVL